MEDLSKLAISLRSINFNEKEHIMFNTIPNNRSLTLMALSVATVSLSACASGGAAYRPIVDGPQDAAYTSDLGECRQVAESRDYLNSDTRTSAAIGAGIGGLIGLADSDNADFGDFVGGAIVGALLGGGDRALETRQERKEIVLNCMAGRGHRVVG